MIWKNEINVDVGYPSVYSDLDAVTRMMRSFAAGADRFVVPESTDCKAQRVSVWGFELVTPLRVPHVMVIIKNAEQMKSYQ